MNDYLKGKRILITGGHGSCAHYMKEELEGHEVFTLSRPECDLRSYEQVRYQLGRLRPDVIFHLAADADVRASFDRAGQVIENNVQSTVNLFEACRSLGIRPDIQICSTSEVYGSPRESPITEDFPLAPINPYAVSKATQDMLGAMYARCYDFHVVRTRAFGYINPRRAGLSLTSFATQIAEIEAGKREFVQHGNLRSIRTFCDVRDMMRAYVLAMPLTGVYNIGSTHQVTIGECLSKLVGLSTVPIVLKSDKTLMRPSDVTSQVPNCRKFVIETGWSPKIRLETSLQWLLDECRAKLNKTPQATRYMEEAEYVYALANGRSYVPISTPTGTLGVFEELEARN